MSAYMHCTAAAALLALLICADEIYSPLTCALLYSLKPITDLRDRRSKPITLQAHTLDLHAEAI